MEEEPHPSQHISTPQHQSIDIFKIFANDKRLILYRPEWRQVTGSVLSTILLSQMLYWWDKMGRKPFYKFKEPCKHQLYKQGESWVEELGFSKKEFDNALKNIATRKSDTTKEETYITYWTDINRVTHYSINEDILEPVLRGIYVNTQTGFTKTPKGDLPPLYTETTSNTTTTTPTSEHTTQPPSKPISNEGLLLLHHQDDINNLINLIPNHNLSEELLPQYKNIISKSLKSGHTVDSISKAIQYTQDKSKGSPFEFKSYLAMTLLNNYHQGYVSKQEELRIKQEKQRQLENDRIIREREKALKDKKELEHIRLKDESRAKALHNLRLVNPDRYYEIQHQALHLLKSKLNRKYDIEGRFVKAKMIEILKL